MAAITKNTAALPTLASMQPPMSSKLSGLVAGMALGSFDACYVDAAGTVFAAMDTGATDAQAEVHGYASRKVASGQVVTLIWDVEVSYAAASGLTKGAKVFLSDAVAGGLDTAAKNSHKALGFARDDRIVYLKQRLN